MKFNSRANIFSLVLVAASSRAFITIASSVIASAPFYEHNDGTEVDGLEFISSDFDRKPKLRSNNADHRTAINVPLAELTFKNGVEVSFMYNLLTKQYGMVQTGKIESTKPLLHANIDSILKVFLEITPNSVPVPELLTFEAQQESNTFLRSIKRRISKQTVIMKNLSVPETVMIDQGQDRELVTSCNDSYFPSYNWHENGYYGMSKKCFTSSSTFKYVSSYIFNCTPYGSPSTLFASHTFYYKFKSGDNWTYQVSYKAIPGYWHTATSTTTPNSYRQVCYDDGWKNSSDCGYGCKYTREGRYYN